MGWSYLWFHQLCQPVVAVADGSQGGHEHLQQNGGQQRVCWISFAGMPLSEQPPITVMF
jgi:hypothetical protein